MERHCLGIVVEGMKQSVASPRQSMQQFVMLASSLVADIASALYGERWASRLARALEVRRETVWRWSVVGKPVPAKMESALRVVLRAEIADRREKFDKWEGLLT
jgi:hypothetical protein